MVLFLLGRRHMNPCSELVRVGSDRSDTVPLHPTTCHQGIQRSLSVRRLVPDLVDMCGTR